MTRPAIEVVHIGSACRDIAPEDPRGWRIGGGVMYAALTTARLGLRTAAVVGVDAAGGRRRGAGHARRGGRRRAPGPAARGPDLPQRRDPDGSRPDERPARHAVADPGPAAGLGGGARLVRGRGGWRGAGRLGGRDPAGRARRGRVAGAPARPPGRGTCPPAAAAPVADPRPRRSRRGQPARRRAGRAPRGADVAAAPGGGPADHPGRRRRAPDPAGRGWASGILRYRSPASDAESSIRPGQGTRSSPRSTPPGCGRGRRRSDDGSDDARVDPRPVGPAVRRRRGVTGRRGLGPGRRRDPAGRDGSPRP